MLQKLYFTVPLILLVSIVISEVPTNEEKTLKKFAKPFPANIHLSGQDDVGERNTKVIFKNMKKILLATKLIHQVVNAVQNAPKILPFVGIVKTVTSLVISTVTHDDQKNEEVLQREKDLIFNFLERRAHLIDVANGLGDDANHLLKKHRLQQLTPDDILDMTRLALNDLFDTLVELLENRKESLPEGLISKLDEMKAITLDSSRQVFGLTGAGELIEYKTAYKVLNDMRDYTFAQAHLLLSAKSSSPFPEEKVLMQVQQIMTPILAVINPDYTVPKGSTRIDMLIEQIRGIQHFFTRAFEPSSIDATSSENVQEFQHILQEAQQLARESNFQKESKELPDDIEKEIGKVECTDKESCGYQLAIEFLINKVSQMLNEHLGSTLKLSKNTFRKMGLLKEFFHQTKRERRAADVDKAILDKMAEALCKNFNNVKC